MSLPEDFFLLDSKSLTFVLDSSFSDLQKILHDYTQPDTTACVNNAVSRHCCLCNRHRLCVINTDCHVTNLPLQWHNRIETSLSHQTIVILQWFVCSPCAKRAANTLYFLCLCFVWILTQPTYICLHHGFLFQNKTYHQTSLVSSPYLLISGYRSLWPFHRFLCLAPYLCQYI